MIWKTFWLHFFYCPLVECTVLQILWLVSRGQFFPKLPFRPEKSFSIDRHSKVPMCSNKNKYFFFLRKKSFSIDWSCSGGLKLFDLVFVLFCFVCFFFFFFFLFFFSLLWCLFCFVLFLLDPNNLMFINHHLKVPICSKQNKYFISFYLINLTC